MENKIKMLFKANIILKRLNVILNLFQNPHLLLTFSIVFFTMNVFAQEKSKAQVESKTQEMQQVQVAEVEEEISWQTLEWEEQNSDFVTHYNIEIEKYNAKKDVYVPVLSLKTEDNKASIKIEPQLSSGVYRYKIISFDLFGFGSAESDWFDLIIYKAYEPEIKSISSNVNYSSTIYIEEYNDGIFNVSGKNLFSLPTTGKEISFTNYFLRRKEKIGNKIFIPVILEVNPNNKQIKIKLEQFQMLTGTYHLIAKDASGLESQENSDSEIIIKFKKMMDFNISLGYSVPFILYDDTFNKYMKSKIWPISFSSKATFIPYKRSWGYLGVGFAGSYSRMSADLGLYNITGNLLTGFTNFVYQKSMYKKISETQNKHVMTFEAYVGGGLVSFINYAFEFNNGAKSESYNSNEFAIDAGIALQYFWASRVYAEADIRYINAFPKGMSFGMIIPTIGIGWQF